MTRAFLLCAVAACTHVPNGIASRWPDGCFTMRDEAGRTIANDRARCDRPRRPYSTFKLANALIALDAGVLSGPDAAMTWDRDAVPDRADWPDSWRRPHTLRSALAVSAVPYFRTLALAIGEARMRAGLAALDYGNRDLGGGLDRFWLDGALRISAARQLAFVDALARGELAVAAAAQRAVADISVLETRGDRVLHGKTGSGPIEDGGGWLVWQAGWIAHAGRIVPYAVWLEVRGGTLDDARAARDRRLRDTLAAIGAFPR
jgi:beta-lactamase class D